MSFGWLGGLMSLMPGYLQGRQQAISDNWTDLEKFNQVQAGQIKNAVSEATAPDEIGKSHLGYDDAYYNTLANAMLAAQGMALHPGKMYQNTALSYMAPDMFMDQLARNRLTTSMAMDTAAKGGWPVPGWAKEFYGSNPLAALSQFNTSYFGAQPSSPSALYRR